MPGGTPLLSPEVAQICLPAALLVGLWVAWTDLRAMRIPNMAVLCLTAAFIVLAPLVLPWAAFWPRLLALLVVLVCGFVLSIGGALGAGDAKYMAAMAPYVAPPDYGLFLLLLAAATLAAFGVHRTCRALPFIRRTTPDWKSWRDARFPLGLALGPALPIYLGWAAFG